MFVKVLRLIFTEVLLLTFFKLEFVHEVIVLGNASKIYVKSPKESLGQKNKYLASPLKRGD
ncbi:hypothetical protein ES705_07303 [subsurface metagenome]